jgi:exopolyphosphatase/guanosine-5'-triphosphate,3'-diphosphate pyrophosphatase
MDTGERKKTEGIGPRRAEIVVAGTAVFLRTLEALNLPGFYYSAAGVRDGIIADLAVRGVGRERSRLARPQVRVAESMCRKYNVEMKNAKQVAGFAAQLFEALLPLHSLPPESGKLLEAAALLHNTGHYISGTGHHKHSAYIVSNSDMPGYTDRERNLVALLCRYHRKSLPAPRHDVFRSLPAEEKRIVQMLTPVLRIAVALDAGHAQKIRAMETTVAADAVTISVRADEDTDLELWAVERVADSFRQTYGLPLAITKSKG